MATEHGEGVADLVTTFHANDASAVDRVLERRLGLESRHCCSPPAPR